MRWSLKGCLCYYQSQWWPRHILLRVIIGQRRHSRSRSQVLQMQQIVDVSFINLPHTMAITVFNANSFAFLPSFTEYRRAFFSFISNPRSYACDEGGIIFMVQYDDSFCLFYDSLQSLGPRACSCSHVHHYIFLATLITHFIIVITTSLLAVLKAAITVE